MAYARLLFSLLLLKPLLQFTARAADTSGNAQLDAGQPYGPKDLSIRGPGAVTVGVPFTYTCAADCSPTCTYTMGFDNQTGQGNELFYTFKQWAQTKIVTCSATNPSTGTSSTTRKTLRVLEGPRDVVIIGPQTLTPGRTQRFLCSATCKPACTYTWTVDGEPTSGSGDEVVIRAPVDSTSGTIICKATNSVSGLFVSAVQKLNATFQAGRSTAERVKLLPTLLISSIITFGIMNTL